MTDSTGILSETHSSSSANEATETQLAQAGDQVQVSEPSVGTSIQLVAAGDSLQLGFDPADVAKAEVKDGNLEITFKSGAVAVVQGYEEWAAAGGQPTGPQGGAVDVAQLGQPAAPAACELPGENVHVVDVPVPADGERLTLAVAPGDALRLACSFRDVHGAEVGNNLEMTFPGGGVVVVENFSEWIAAKGATISDCVCGGVNPADFIVALGLNPEDVLPAAGGEGPGGPLPADSPAFAPGPGPGILHSFDHPHILPPTALGYGLPDLEETFFPVDEEDSDDLGGPIASAPDPLRVVERTEPLQGGTLSFNLAGFDKLVAADVDAEDNCAPPTGPVQFVQDQASGQIFVNDDFGPDGRGDPPLFSLIFTGSLLVDAIHGILQGDGHTLRITSLDSIRPGFIDIDILTGLTTVHLTGAFDHGGKDDGANVAVQTFNYTIQDKDGDKSTTQVTIEIVDSVPVAHSDCEICVTEGAEGGVTHEGDVVPLVDGAISGNVLLNDDLGADQFLPDGTNVTSIKYTDESGNLVEADVAQDGSNLVVDTKFGTLTIDQFGDWTFETDDEVEHDGSEVNDGFTYTITDGDGDTSTAEQPICIKDNVEPPEVTMVIGVDGDGGCVEEDSKLGDPDNRVDVHAEAQADDNLTQLVITGFTQEPDWAFDFAGMNTTGVTGVAYDAATGTLTVTFGPGVQVFDGSFFVEPPADSDVDLGTLTATATAAASDDPTQTLDSSTNLDVHVDANADPVSLTIDVNDSGDDGATFQTNETGTLAIGATFGDVGDGSEDHSVLVEIPDGFTATLTNPLPTGVTALVNAEGNVEFTVANDVPGFNYVIAVQNTSGGEGSFVFTATARAEETNTGDIECDPDLVEGENVATQTKNDTTTVTIVDAPDVNLALANGGACVEEDSILGDPNNVVNVSTVAQPGDVLTQLVITGFNNQPGWTFNFGTLDDGANAAKVQSINFNAATGTLTILFNAGVSSFDGSFSVQPPANSDVDLGTLTATATAADGVDPTQTASASDSEEVHVDANADPVTVTIDVNDSGDAGATFQTGEGGTLAIGATFGDTGDGSEDHSVLVTIPDGFTATLTNPLPAGVTALVNAEGNVEFTVANNVPGFNYVITVTNTSAGEGDYVFTATSRAEETNTGDVECNPDLVEGENVATQTKNDTTTVTVVDEPNVNLALANGGACVEEDSVLGDPNNVVNVSTAAQPGDVLTQLVITGFNNQPGWQFNFDTLDDGVNAAKVQSVSFNAATGTLTILFNAGVSSFDGSFSVQPPANTDVDLGTLTATATAADGVDPTQTASASDSEEVHVDANADPVTVTLNVNDSGDANSTFQQNEVGTVQVVAAFGDFQDGSEIHTVLVDVPAGFTVGALNGLPAGVTAQVVDGNNVLFTVAQGTAGFDYTFNVTNAGGNGPAVFTATATANENPPSDIECDPSDADNIKTAVDTENEQKQDDTPVINPAPVLVDDDDTPGFNGGPTDTIDPPTASATASLGASFGVDAPGTVVFGANANPSVLSHGDAISYTLSGDSKTLTATADAGGSDQRVVYTVAINADGTYTFTLLDALDHAPGGGENDLGLNFNVTATDKDGDSTGGVIAVTVNDDSPISTGGVLGTVEEDNLPGGIDENAGINLTTSGSFGINFGADGPGDISTITGPAGLTSGGDPVTYSFNAATNTLTGSAGGSPVFTVALNPETGQYTFTLSGPLDHPAGGGGGDEQALNLNFGFTATDFDGDPVNGSFTVAVRDDVPVAGDNSVDTTADQSVNIMIMFDRSGSMDENPNMDGYSSRIDLARAAVAALLETYGSFADVNVKIVDFSSTATSTGWMTIEQANAYLAGLEADGNTNYAAALNEAATTFNTGLPDADRNLVYFLSDGKPTNSSGSPTSLTAGQITAWENFAKDDANNIEQVFAIGIGGDIPNNDPDLEAVAFKDTNNDGIDETPSSVVVSNESLLLSALVSTVANVVTGNVITDTTADKFGADGPGSPSIKSIQIGGDLYAYDGEDITKNGGAFASNTAILAVATGLLGAFLTFDFADGDFTYKAPDSDTDQTFVYTIVDGDGDTDTGNLTFLNSEITDEQSNQVFGNANDNNLVGDGNPSTFVDVMGGDDGNDTISGGLGSDHITGGAGADNLSGGDDNDVIIGGTSSEVVDSNTIRAADGNDTIDGGKGNDYLFGNDGADVIHGGEGNDFIVGGIPNLADGSEGALDLADQLFGDAGNDTIIGGNGNDSVTGGAGDDTINVAEDNDVVFYTSKLDGHDVINNFNADNDTSSTSVDQLNLDALFDSLSVATVDRAGRVQISDTDGPVVQINVDTDNNGSFDLNVATLNTVDNGTVNVGQEIIVGTG